MLYSCAYLSMYEHICAYVSVCCVCTWQRVYVYMTICVCMNVYICKNDDVSMCRWWLISIVNSTYLGRRSLSWGGFACLSLACGCVCGGQIILLINVINNNNIKREAKKQEYILFSNYIDFIVMETNQDSFLHSYKLCDSGCHLTSLVSPQPPHTIITAHPTPHC